MPNEKLLVPADAVEQLRQESQKIYANSPSPREIAYVSGISFALRVLGQDREEGKA